MRARLIALAFSVLGIKASPPVKVSLRTSWPAPPPIIEALETIALDNPNSFFSLIDYLTEPDFFVSVNTLNPSALHQAVLQVASENGLLNERATVEMNLALHAATPKIQAGYNYYHDHYGGTQGDECGSWVDWNGQVICDVRSLERVINTKTNEVDSTESSPMRLLAFDHVHPASLIPSIHTAILYGSIGSPNFRELHTYLFSHSRGSIPRLQYVYRHVPPQNRNSKTLSYLSGYGVALNLKKMDYLAVDDRNNNSNTEKDKYVSNKLDTNAVIDPILELIHEFPESEGLENVNVSLTEDELKDLGSKTTQLIANSKSPLNTLSLLSQNFPKYASLVSRRVITNSSTKEEIHRNTLKAQPGVNMFWLNGATISEKDINPLGLLRLLKKERETMSSLTSLGMSQKEAFEVITHINITNAHHGGLGVVEGMVDASDRPEGGGTIVWWNDIEKDRRYARWPKSLFALLQPSYGSWPVTRFNLFNLVLVLDLSQPTSIAFLSGQLPNLINNNFPIRIGFVPVLEKEDGIKMARLLYYLIEKHSRKTALTFFQRLSDIGSQDQKALDWKIVRDQYANLKEQEPVPATDSLSDNKFADLDDVLAGDEQIIGFLSYEGKARIYAERLSANLASCSSGHAFMNGKHIDLKEGFMRQVSQELGKQLNYLQENIYRGDIQESPEKSFSTYFYDLLTTTKRRNRYISDTGPRSNLRIFNLPELLSRVGFIANAGSYVYSAEPHATTLSLYIIADLDSEIGLRAVGEALTSIGPTSSSRVTFVHNPVHISPPPNRLHASWLLSHLIMNGSLFNATPLLLVQALGLDMVPPAHGSQTKLSQNVIFSKMIENIRNKAGDLDQHRYTEYVSASRRFAKEVGALPGQRVIVANGRVVGPLESDDFIASDFALLESYEHVRRTGPIVAAVEDIIEGIQDLDQQSYANLMSMTSSIISAVQQLDPAEMGLFDKPQNPRSTAYRLLESGSTKFEIGDESTALYRIAMLLDPLSETAQKWSSLVQWLSNIPGAYIEVHLNPVPVTEMPLRSFYRYNLLPFPKFDENGQEILACTIFEDLPIEPIYTLAMDVPPSWLVRPREALYDLDNLQLGYLLPGDTSVDAIFDLDYLVIEGHVRESLTNSPPRGVQLELVRKTKNKTMPIDDTQVVANLGYIQFKTEPGVFGLEIRMGRGRDVFDMESVGNEGWVSSSIKEAGNEVTVTSFEGLVLYPRLERKEGMEGKDVLAGLPPEEGFFSGLVSSVTSFLSPKTNVAEDQAEINIFTVASGLLYERFASIMILSVLRNTNNTVKFWFIENFLSPSFLEFIPHMAAAYNFKYEFVTYKWPSWLRSQSEKQRIIWGYKILFLDVLFPMDLKKVIFVDADQIVRADLKELVDLDLKGAPYGYTPMGDDNRDMEGFRFWKTGYWKDFLAGRPYHISALYVIDLVRFRQIAAGDILRGQYQALSADPNSLANLDQDLPNNLQHQVPIFSLHEDWLWCETWCSKDRLHRAKTIDLCQNPLTKEPKLSRARQIPEWELYDAEIASFTRKLVDDGVIHSGMSAADANVLANVGTVGRTLSQCNYDSTSCEGREKLGDERDSRSSAERKIVFEPLERSDGPSEQSTRDEL